MTKLILLPNGRPLKISLDSAMRAGQLSAAHLDAEPIDPVHRGSHANDQGPNQATWHAFDPFAFGVVTTLMKLGRDALIEKLEKIQTPHELRRLAAAQRLAIDDHLETPDAIRRAIVRSAEFRIRERRAAAS